MIIICFASILLLIISTTQQGSMKQSEQKKLSRVDFTTFQKQITEAVTDEQPQAFATHVIQFMLDDSEQTSIPSLNQTYLQFSAVSRSIAQALENKVAPFICTTMLLKALLKKSEEMSKNAQCSDINDTVKKYNASANKEREKLQKTIDKQLESFEEKLDLNYALCFINILQNINDWIILQPIDSLCFLIPKNYKLFEKSPTLQAYIPKKLTAESPLTELELALGIKLDHMQPLTPETLNIHQKNSQYMQDFINLLNNGNIFITKVEYAAINKQKRDHLLPQWAIYSTGHGTTNQLISGLEISQFKKLLQFLDTKIWTKFFFYNTCYGAGVNAEIIYEDIKKPLSSQTYPFIIVTNALTDDRVTFKTDTILNTKQEPATIEMVLPMNFPKFIQLIRQNSPNLSELISSIAGTKHDFVGTSPQVRLPGLPWFSILDINKKTISLNKTLSNNCKGYKEGINIQTFFKHKNPEIILLYSPFIPCELKINTPSNKPLAFVPMYPQPTEEQIYRIAKISSTTRTVDDLIYSFIQMKSVGTELIFIIGEIITQQTIYHNIAITFRNGRPQIFLFDAKSEGYRPFVSHEDIVAKAPIRFVPLDQYSLDFKKLMDPLFKQLEELAPSTTSLSKIYEQKTVEAEKSLKSREAKKEKEDWKKQKEQNLLSQLNASLNLLTQ